MVNTGPDPMPMRIRDLRDLGFTLAVTILTVLLFGAVPAFRRAWNNLALKEGRGIVADLCGRLARV